MTPTCHLPGCSWCVPDGWEPEERTTCRHCGAEFAPEASGTCAGCGHYPDQEPINCCCDACQRATFAILAPRENRSPRGENRRPVFGKTRDLLMGERSPVVTSHAMKGRLP